MAETARRPEALRDSLYFQSRAMVDDGFGNMVPGGEFETQFGHSIKANLKPLRGSEAVMAARLAGTQPYVITVRSSSETRQINVAWQAVDANDASRVFAITAPPTDPDGKRAWLEILAVQGGLS